MREIYLDNAATTRVRREVAETALTMMLEQYGNPSSLHTKGFQAERLLAKAREQIAGALGAQPEELVFCSGGTEANNLALLGAVAAHHRRGKTIVTTQTEHASVLETAAHLETQGFTVRRVPPAPDGGADIGAIENAVDGDTMLVSCTAVNSETGAVTDIQAAANAVKRKKPDTLFHSDAVQAFGKLPVSLYSPGIDLLTVSAHKIEAPKGAGALFVRRGARILPLLRGGGQEKSLRAGTESTPLICAFGEAAALATNGLEEARAHLNTLALHFRARAASTPGVVLNSSPEGSPWIHNISVPGYRSESLLHYLSDRGVYISSGSACSKGRKSHVLTAMGLARERIDSALRISLCRTTRVDELDAFFECLASALNGGIQAVR